MKYAKGMLVHSNNELLYGDGYIVDVSECGTYVEFQPKSSKMGGTIPIEDIGAPGGI